MADPHARSALAATATTDADPGHDAIPGTTIRFFISSTFADFRVERDVLQRRVFRDLRQMCRAAGFRLQPIDLRWGVSEAAGTDRQTLRICFDELERCRRLSPDFFLLILLGQRYGSYILPPQVPGALVVRLLPRLAPDQRRAFEAAYRLDDNAVPPEYALLRAQGPEREEDASLRKALAEAAHAVGVSAEDALLFSGSATHREIQLGLLGQPAEGQAQGKGATGIMGALRRLTGAGAGGGISTPHETSGVLCALRAFTGEPRGDLAARFVESSDEWTGQMRRLDAAVLSRLSTEQVLRYDVTWRGEQGPAWDEEVLAQRYMDFLRPRIESIIATRMAARKAAAARGRDTVALANAAFERERTPRMEGHAAELAHVTDYLASKTGAQLPLVVTGAAGSGKSTLLAEAVTRTAATQPRAVRITRYIGVTPGTGSLRELLEDLRRAIALAYGQPEPDVPANEDQLVGSVASLLATLKAPPDQPLLLVLDALDQLGAQAQRTDWLPARLAPHVRVVVSVLADRPELGYLSRRLPAEQVVTLAPLGREAGQRMLGDLLGAAPARTLSHDQQEAVLAAFAAQGMPLYLRLLASEARRWRSFDPPTLGSSRPLPTTTPELLQAILARLEQPERHGRMLVARSLGDLAAARLGLAEDELLDLLAGDDDVSKEQHALSPSSPPIEKDLPLPVALWAELYAELAPLLSERTVDDSALLYTFYHRQFREAVEARYLAGAERAARHRALAGYFARQSWRLGTNQWNLRKADELVTQFEGAGDRPAAEQALNALAGELEQPSNGQRADWAGITSLIRALGDRLDFGGYLRTGERIYAQALGVARSAGDRQAEGGVLNALGTMARMQGRAKAAAGYYEQGLAVARAGGDRTGEGNILVGLGAVAAAQGRPEAAAEYYEQALAVVREVGNRISEGVLLSLLGDLARVRGQVEAAARYLEQALATCREVGDRQGEGIALGNLGMLALATGQPKEAARYYEQALAVAREIGDRADEGLCLNNLGQLAAAQGKPDAARYYEQALAVAREVGNHDGEATALNNLGVLTGDQGQPEAAARYYKQALTIVREAGYRQHEAATLNNLGTLAQATGKWAAARDSYEQALEISREVGDQVLEGTTLSNLGILAQATGNWAAAHDYYDRALIISREVGDRDGEGTSLNNLGTLAKDQGQLDAAAQYYEQALATEQDVGDRPGQGITLSNLGLLSHARGNAAVAREYYERALAIHREVGDRVGEATTLNNLGGVAHESGDGAAARDYFERALAIRREIGDRAGEAITLNNLGGLAAAEGQLDDAAQHYQKALAISDEVGDRDGMARAHNNLGTVASRQGRQQDAKRHFERALAIFEQIGAVAEARMVRQNIDVLAPERKRSGWWPFG